MASTPDDDEGSKTLDLKKAQFANARADVDRVSRNMALADSPQQLKAMQKVFDETTATAAKLEAEIELLRTVQTRRASESDVDAAMALATRLADLASESSLKAAGEAIRLADVKLYFRIERVQEGKRLLNKVAGGIATIGSADPPIEVYAGRTDHKSVKGTGSTFSPRVEPAPESRSNDPEEESLGNVNRGGGI